MNKLTENLELDEAECWRAVAERDASAEAKFVYGVLSTRVFCRASCPSRRPRRENARFFATPALAIAAGYRACKRCRPQLKINAATAQVRAICERLATQECAPSLAELGREFGLSPSHLQRTFKRAMGMSPREYANSLRAQRLKRNLQAGQSVTDATYKAGYGSSRALYESASSQLGMTPATYGRGGAHARIRFGIAPCALGLILVATTEIGVCSIALGDEESALEAELRAEFFVAIIERDDAFLAAQLQLVNQLLAGETVSFDLPLDVRATAFQARVWRELRAIPRGQTRTYAQVAQSLEMPTAARAVARACATNPVALVVPCHRVVRGDGNLAGYRWGIERKKRLLNAEKLASGERGFAFQCGDFALDGGVEEKRAKRHDRTDDAD